MKKSLVSALVVASVLAFNACKKEAGPQGEKGDKGDKGDAGAPGAAGPVGPAGAAGKDGTKVLTGDTAPTATTGVDGDFYFQKSNSTLYGPKTAGAWPAGTSLKGEKGDKGDQGDQGAAGTQFLTGSTAPAAGTGNVGDYYFDSSTSTFYGPKTATGWASNVFPLAAAHAAKTFYLTRGLEGVTQTLKKVGQTTTVSYPHSGPNDEIQAVGVKYNADDLERRASYPGWADNREMIFESTPGSGVFDVIPQNGLPVTWGVTANNPGGNSASLFRVGAKFRYTHNHDFPTAEFILTADDIDRATKDNGAFYDAYTYAKIIDGVGGRTVAVGNTFYFFRTKHVTVTDNPSGPFRAEYTAKTEINLNTIPGLLNKIESYKQDGKVYLKYRYVNAANGTTTYQTGAGAQLGWVDLTDSYLNQYTVAGAAYGPNGMYTTANSHGTTGYTVNPFTTPFTLVGGSVALGNAGTVTIAADQVLTHVNTVARPQVTKDGHFVFHWDISSGSNTTDATTAVPFGPITLVNPNASLNPVGTSYTSGVYNMTNTAIPHWTARTFADTYYSTPSLTASVNGAAVTPVGAAGTVNILQYANGQPAAYFEGKPLVQVQLFVVPGDIVKAAQAAGINVNNPEALAKFADLQK
jgi:hypothetical protein